MSDDLKDRSTAGTANLFDMVEIPGGTLTSVVVSENPLPSILSTAFDLYRRGLNVFPLPSAWEWKARPDYDTDPNKKPPYLLTPLYFSRLHNCGPDCNHLPQDKTFNALFTHANIGVMTGRTSGNLISLDCDSHAALETIGSELTRRALPFWGIGSHRGGAYLLRILEGETPNMAETHFPDVQVWGNAHYQVLPPSIHPLGTIYRWITPEPRYCLPEGQSLPPVSITTLEWLGLILAINRKWQAPELHGLPEWAAMLSRRNRETLAKGVLEGQRNARLTAAAYDLAGNEIAYDDAEAIILAAAERCTPPYSNGDTLAILKCAYNQERQPARKSGESVKPWKKAQDFAETFDWRGKYGRKAIKRRAVFLACIERARQSNSDVWRASKRELSELSNMPNKTAWIALQDLKHDGLIILAELRDRSGANLYSFDLSRMTPLYTPCSNSGYFLDNPKTQAEQDVFGKLGLTSWHIWRYLLATPAHNAGTIARALNFPRSSVYAALIRLQDAGLAVFGMAEGMYYGESKTDADLEYQAIAWGAHSSENRKQTHRSEREKRVNGLMAHARARYVTVTQL
jgi:hypothetical protein